MHLRPAVLRFETVDLQWQFTNVLRTLCGQSTVDQRERAARPMVRGMTVRAEVPDQLPGHPAWATTTLCTLFLREPA